MTQEKLEEAKRLYQTANQDQKYVLESLFPELAESEDETTRKELINFVKSRLAGFQKCEKYIAWLEKQAKQKPAWSEEDEKLFKTTIDSLNAYAEKAHPCLNSVVKDEIDWLKSLKQRYTWKPSDEQLEAFEHFVRSMGESGYASPYNNKTKLLYSLLSDLKKLREE